MFKASSGSQSYSDIGKVNSTSLLAKYYLDDYYLSACYQDIFEGFTGHNSIQRALESIEVTADLSTGIF